MEKDTVLVLRSCAADMTSKNGFKWPTSGPVSCDDFEPTKQCGNGLHGLLEGDGDWSLVSFEKTAKWLVVEVAVNEVVNLAGKVKFPRGNVVFCGSLTHAAKFMSDHLG